jgi:hypothetical protein
MVRRRLGSKDLQAQAIELDRRIKEVAAKEKAKREADDHRRNLLAGQAALWRMTTEPQSEFAATLLRLIDERARSVADRALFDLLPLTKNTEEPQGQNESDVNLGAVHLAASRLTKG